MPAVEKHVMPEAFLPPREDERILKVDQAQIVRKPDALLVLSGGMDSTTMLYEYRSRIALVVTFLYGSNHNRREADCARWHCERLGIKHLEIPLGFMAEYFKSSLLSGADAIPEGYYDDENMKSTVVPFRNGIMLAVAAGLAESQDLTTECSPITPATMPYIPTAVRSSSTRWGKPSPRAPMRGFSFSARIRG